MMGGVVKFYRYSSVPVGVRQRIFKHILHEPLLFYFKLLNVTS